MWCHHCYDSSHHSEQCPSIGNSLGLGQNHFDTFQGPTNEPYPSNFNYEGWNCPQYSWDQSYQSNWSYTEPSLPSWGFDNRNEDLQGTLEKSIEIMQQCILQNNQLNQELIETSARRDMHFDEITNYLNQPASTPIPDQSQEFHQCY